MFLCVWRYANQFSNAISHRRLQILRRNQQVDNIRRQSSPAYPHTQRDQNELHFLKPQQGILGSSQ